MIEKVRETIKKHSMFARGEVVAVAVSGGLDSTVLLHALSSLKEDLGVKLVVCHLNHGLRGEESKRDYSFVEALALKFALPFEGAELPAGALLGSSTQAAAREARYAFLADTARRRGASKIALGHTLDDHAETVLMRFVKGSGPGGLKGIAPVRQEFVRPLIEVTREEVARYAEAHSPPIEYVEDSSNASDKYLRNALRHDLIPHIKERYNPNIINTLSRTALISARDDEYLNLRAESAYADALSEDGPLGVVFDRGKLLKMHPAVSTRVFLKGASVLGKRARLYACHINRFLDLIKGSKPNVRAMLPGGLALVREYDRITLSTAPLRTPATFDMAIAVPGTTGVEEAGFVVSATIAEPPSLKALGAAPMTAFFDYDAIPGDVSIRSLKPGDTMVPMGMRGRKKLKDIFIDSKVPALKRARTPVLYAGGRIIWAVGLRQSDNYKVLKSTSRVLKVECSRL